MANGDHIYVSLWTNGNPFTHHGIDCGDGTVIHYDGQRICLVSKNAFAEGKTIHIKEYGKCDADEIIVQRAKTRLREDKYCPASNNCEHFAFYCKTGKHKSDQVNKVAAVGGGVVAGGAISFGTKVAIKAAVETAKNSINPISKVLINVGIKQAPTVAGRVAGGIAGVGGLVSGVATDLVVSKVLEDDENLSEHEREARKNGRDAGKIGAIAGGLAGGPAAAMVGGGAAIAVGVAAPAVLGIGVALGVYHFGKKNKK
ncbi:lecithin retinol acyltransferase family protein [Nostoc sp. 'Lobaria pulmonaria (5183) cyanobiont']|uniref:lecithin retinol acyltransferase family protein n=1 Tax=Nostoc sp. 'Lobaria pulmonaria (5183) cyanobiont' TaxID=1618022 RepID=UPI000CF36205|nr:lecithin retinol acyltransferase family protein [Nostoc sp. 'Lobaria pulmonaria (5183) cyanobiont']AVH69993.1 LRAT domain-containing protein [Nostoc sp. 'Lobaria pulmonaria (5183) cyanobiont']